MIQQQQEPLVSIIVPCYNYARFLEECFRNLVAQHYSNWECLMVDNASTDDTKEVIHDLSKRDSRFKYFYQPVKGPSAARNMGIAEAKGEFIQFLDADDLLSEYKLSSGISLFLSNQNLAIVYSDMRYFPDKNSQLLFYGYALDKVADRPWMSYVSGGRKEVLPTLLQGNIMVISSPLIKKTSLQKTGVFNEGLAYNEDWQLWLKFALRDEQFQYDSSANALTLIRVHDSSHSRNRYKMYYCGLYVCYEVAGQLSASELNNDYRKKIHYHEYMLFKQLQQFPTTEIRAEFRKITAITGKYKAVCNFIQAMPRFVIKSVLLGLTFKKYLQHRYF